MPALLSASLRTVASVSFASCTASDATSFASVELFITMASDLFIWVVESATHDTLDLTRLANSDAFSEFAVLEVVISFIRSDK